VSSRTGSLIIAGALVLVIAVVCVAAGPEVLDKGRLLSYTSQNVWRVRLFDSFDVWVAKDAVRPLDALNGAILAGGAGMAALGALLTRIVAPRTNRFFVILAAGLAYLAADELFALHETFGYNLGFLARLPGIDGPDDVFFALYIIPVLGFFIFYWDLILASRWGARLVAGGLLLFGLGAALNLANASLHQQWLKPASSVALVCGVSLVALRHLSWSAAAASLRPDAAETRGDRSPPART
jgi:hypothetical protein